MVYGWILQRSETPLTGYPNDWLEIVEISSGRDSELNFGAHALQVAIERPQYCQLQPNTIFFNEQETGSVDKVCN